jgi:hypothetical protein
MGIQNCDYPPVLYGCQTWRLRLFENRALGSIFESEGGGGGGVEVVEG